MVIPLLLFCHFLISAFIQPNAIVSHGEGIFLDLRFGLL